MHRTSALFAQGISKARLFAPGFTYKYPNSASPLLQLPWALHQEGRVGVHCVVSFSLDVGYYQQPEPERTHQVGPAHIRWPVMAHIDPRRPDQQDNTCQQSQQRRAEPTLLEMGEHQVEQEPVEGHVVHHMARWETGLSQAAHHAHEVAGRARAVDRVFYDHGNNITRPRRDRERALHAEARGPHERSCRGPRAHTYPPPP